MFGIFFSLILFQFKAEDPFGGIGGGGNNLTNNFSNDSQNAASASNTFNTSDPNRDNPYSASFNNKPPSPVKPATNTNFTSPTTGASASASAATASYGYDDNSSSSNQRTLSPSVIQRAQKACKFASSALQYDDVDTAVKHLEECLQLLKTGK